MQRDAGIQSVSSAAGLLAAQQSLYRHALRRTVCPRSHIRDAPAASSPPNGVAPGLVVLWDMSYIRLVLYRSKAQMSLDHAILGFLTSQPLTGYDLKTRRFDEATAHLWTADQAQVYRTLSASERSGLVSARLIPQPGRPDRKEFAITAAGRARCASGSRHPPALAAARPAAAAAFFAGSLTTTRSSRCWTPHATASSDAWRRCARTTFPGTRPVREATVRQDDARRRDAQARAAIDWLDDCGDADRCRLPVNGDALELIPARVEAA